MTGTLTSDTLAILVSVVSLSSGPQPLGIKIARRNFNLRYADDTTLMPESEKELKSLLMTVKEESEKDWLETQHSKI